VLGPRLLAELRLVVAAATLLAWAWMTGGQVHFTASGDPTS